MRCVFSLFKSMTGRHPPEALHTRNMLSKILGNLEAPPLSRSSGALETSVPSCPESRPVPVEIEFSTETLAEGVDS